MKKSVILKSLFFLTSSVIAQPNSHWENNSGPNAIPGSCGNVGFGVGTMPAITTGCGNTAVGYNSGLSLNSGSYNCIIGSKMLGGSVGAGSRNVYIGSDGNGPSIVNGTGNLNVAVGFRTGLDVIGGSDKNVFIGAWAGPGSVWAPGNVPWVNAIAIGGGNQTGSLPGRSATVMDNNNMILGNNDIHVGIGLSGRLPAVQNKLEINADPANFCFGCSVPAPFTANSPYNNLIPGSWPGGSTGASGLRFRDLTSASIPLANGVGGVNNNKLLSVDQNGDVVLVSVPTTPSCCLGNICNLPNPGTNPLTNNWEIPLNNNNFVFSGQGPVANTNYRVGIGTGCNPGNKLEIDNGSQNPGTSGLRLTRLTSASPTSPSNNKVLSVNANGDVILVPDQTGGGGVGITQAQNGLSINQGNPNIVELGGPLGSAGPAALLAHREIPMSSNKIFFSGQTGDGLVIGPNVLGVPSTNAKLQIVANDGFGVNAIYAENQTPGTNNNAIVAKAYNNPGNTSYGVHSTAQDARTSVGVYGQALTNPWPHTPGNPGSSTGIWGSCNANDAVYHYAVKGEASGSSSENTGGKFIGSGGTTAMGVYGLAVNAQKKYAVYGESSGNSQNNTVDNWAGYFQGDQYTNGTVYSSNPAFNGSDRRFKQNIQKLENVTEKIQKLSGYTYKFKTEEFKEKNFSDKEQIGLIAQELKEVFPQLVNEDSKGYLAVNYMGMVPVLLEALKEQQKEIDELRSLVSSNSNAAARTAALAVKLSDKNVVVLDQNVPNPFAETTVITYNIPSDFSKAQILFHGADGKLIKSVDVLSKGEGQLNVFADNLSSGTYTYSLIIDGKIVETKKMIKE